MKQSAINLDYEAIFKGLNQIRVEYIVVGGLAVNLHGIPRMTYDIDLVISLEPKNILKLVSRLTAWGYRPRAPVDPHELADEAKRRFWVEDKGMMAFSFYGEKLPIGEIDLLIASPIPYAELKERAIFIELQGENVPLVSIPDLIQLKLKAGRNQDLSDIEHLKLIMEK
jgi:hypothetical protein